MDPIRREEEEQQQITVWQLFLPTNPGSYRNSILGGREGGGSGGAELGKAKLHVSDFLLLTILPPMFSENLEFPFVYYSIMLLWYRLLNCRRVNTHHVLRTATHVLCVTLRITRVCYYYSTVKLSSKTVLKQIFLLLK